MNQYLVFLVVLVLISASILASADNILFLQTLASPSHHIWNKQIFERLHSNGHNLTILSFQEEQSVPGKTFLVAENFTERFRKRYSEEWDYMTELNPLVNIYVMYDVSNMASQMLVEEEAVRRLLAYPKSFKFDLIIHDTTLAQFLLGFVEYFGNPPLVSVSAFNIPPHITTLADVPLRTSYMPHFASSFDTRMSFIERVKNTVYWTFDIFLRNNFYMVNENRRAERLFGKNATSLALIEQRSDVVLVNTDFSMDYYQPLPPNVIPVGGLHISRSEQVPPDVEQFIARAGKGIVLLSFGTNFGSEMLGEQINKQMYDVFKSIPEYGFIWKHGNHESLGLMPSNVLVMPWVPQASILASPRTKLLISHGGLLSLQEATWRGVPAIAVPFFVDQYSNADKLEKSGTGMKLLPKNLNEKTLRDAIETIVNNESYFSNMKQKSHHFKRQPEHPLDRAIFWIEKVLENKGLGYLRSPAHDMYLFQICGLDMIAVIVVVALGFYLIISRRHIRRVPTTPTSGTDNSKSKTE